MLKSRVPQADLRAINYGHFGIPVYDPTLREWTFSKLAEKTTAFFAQVGNVEQLAPATGTVVPTKYLRNVAEQTQRPYYKTMERETRLLASVYPEMQPAELTYYQLVRLSEGIAQALEEYDPAASELLDTGNLSWRTAEHESESFELLALPGGECGEALRLSRLRSQDYSTQRDRTFEVNEATGETGWWTGKGAPILQICFSRSVEGEGKGALLAVRLQGCIVLMFPRYRARPVPAPGIELEDPPPASRIDPNILFELYPDQMQGIRSADVTFNPWNYREFATIDQAGQWTTFNIVRQDKQFPVYEPEQSQKGRMPKIVDEEEEETRNEEAGGAPEEGQTEPPQDKAGGQSFDRETTAPPDIAEWAAGVPQIKTSASRHTSPSLEDLADTSSDQQEDQGPEKSKENSGPSEAAEAAQAHNVEEADQTEGDDEVPELRQDGWARITWVLNKDTLVVSSRKAIHILNKTAGEIFDLPRMLLVDTLAPGWYFDVKLCYDRPDHIFVLTSQSVFFVRIFEDQVDPEKEQDGQQNDFEEEPKRVLKGRIVVSALHFRDTSDTSLRLHVSTEDHGYMATIYSQWNKVMTSFRFEIPRSVDEPPLVSEAMPLIIPEDAYGRALSLMVSRIRMHQNLDDMSLDGNSRNLYSVQFLGKDYGLRHYFFENRGPEAYTRAVVPRRLTVSSHRNEHPAQPEPRFIIPDHEVRESVRRTATDAVVEVEEDADDEDCLDGENGADGARAEESEEEGPTRTVITSMLGYRHYPMYVFLDAARAVAQNISAGGDPLVRYIDMSAISARIQEAVANHETAQSWQKTIFEHIGHTTPKVGDLRDASFELEDAFASSSSLATVKVKPHLLPLPLGIDDDGDEVQDEENDLIPFDQMHSYLEENYVATLDHAFPSAFRQQREQLVKSVAAELILASARIEHKVKKEEPHDGDVEMEELLAESSQGLGGLSQATDLDEKSQQATPATIGQFKVSRTSPYRSPVNDTMLEITRRLEKNARIAIKTNEKWSLKAAVMLSHWDIGADPEDYSFQQTIERLEEDKKNVGMSEQEKRRMRRRQGRDQIRREREARKAQRLNQQSSGAPNVLSSQVSGIAASQSSQTRPSQSAGVPLIRGSQQTAPSSPIPGFGTPTATPARVRKEKAIPGFGGESSRTAAKPRKEKRAGPSQQEYAGPSQSQGQSQSQPVGLPTRPADTASLPTPSQTQATASSQDVAGSQRPADAFSSQVTIEGSQMPVGSQSQRLSSQITGSQAQRKKKKRKEGF